MPVDKVERSFARNRSKYARAGCMLGTMILLPFATSCAQRPNADPHIPVMNADQEYLIQQQSKPRELGSPILCLDQEYIDLGEILLEKLMVPVRFEITNTGTQPLRMIELVPSCQCVDVKWRRH